MYTSPPKKKMEDIRHREKEILISAFFAPISAFYPHFSVLSTFQRFIPHFSVLSPISAFYPHFSVLSPFQFPLSVSVSAIQFQRFIPTLVSRLWLRVWLCHFVGFNQ